MVNALLRSVSEELARHAPFDQMTEDDRLWLAARLEVSYFPQDAVLLAPEHGPADRLFLVRRGRVAADQGGGDVLELTAGECFPLGALLGRRPTSSGYRAVVDTFCFVLLQADFDALQERSATFRTFCTQRLATLLAQSRRQMAAEYARAQADNHNLEAPLHQTIRREPVALPPGATIRDVLTVMRTQRVGSVVMVDDQSRPQGIFTLQDLLPVALDAVMLEAPIATVMSRQLITLPTTAAAFEAALEMARHGIRHIVVLDGERLAGVVSERDLFAMQRMSLRQIAGAITGATQLPALVAAAEDIQKLARNLFAQGIKPEQVTRVISALNDRLSERVVQCVFAEADLAGLSWCWLTFGSEGRLEQTMASDQDNGLVFAAAADQVEAVRGQLLPLARQANEWLAACGFPLCKGNIMASNPDCCLSLEEWQARFIDWVHNATPEALLNATIFFDMRGLYGDRALAQAVRDFMVPLAAGMQRFQWLLAGMALQNRPPIGFWRDFHPGEDQRLDLKVNGTALFVDAARVMSLADGIDAVNTLERLERVGKCRQIPEAVVAAWREAFLFLQFQRLAVQYQAIRDGTTPGNRLDPQQLNELDRRILKESLRQAGKLQAYLQVPGRP